MAKPRNTRKHTKEMQHSQKSQPRKSEKPPSWAVVRGIFTCKNLQAQQQKQEENKQKQKQKQQQNQATETEETSKKCKKMKCSVLLCSNTKVMQKPETSIGSMKTPLNELNGTSNGVIISSTDSSLSASSNSSIGGSFRGMSIRRFSSCYECKMVVDPVLGLARDPSLRGNIFSCPECGEIFMKAENLELHQAVRHAVSEPDPEDTSKNIVEIIFQSSWLKKQTPICKIDRILKSTTLKEP